ncbi:hypothetical protein OFO01_08825 [Campylobacter sp. JMF_01 NE2]|nr:MULTISPECIES: hypothetical protein [unclassified Campylobacter]MDA3053696.1 hypothetical protein [Campylobacter sp. JMF_03 NE3]MDA3067885.1 hypothetical protein [Campylobacter sp. JMF_01 NE2]
MKKTKLRFLLRFASQKTQSDGVILTRFATPYGFAKLHATT